VLAAEAGVPYASIALVTDRDTEGAGVTMEEVLRVLHDNVARLRLLLEAAIPNLP